MMSGGCKRVHFNDVLGVTASILISYIFMQGEIQ